MSCEHIETATEMVRRELGEHSCGPNWCNGVLCCAYRRLTTLEAQLEELEEGPLPATEREMLQGKNQFLVEENNVLEAQLAKVDALLPGGGPSREECIQDLRDKLAEAQRKVQGLEEKVSALEWWYPEGCTTSIIVRCYRAAREDSEAEEARDS